MPKAAGRGRGKGERRGGCLCRGGEDEEIELVIRVRRKRCVVAGGGKVVRVQKDLSERAEKSWMRRHSGQSVWEQEPPVKKKIKNNNSSTFSVPIPIAIVIRNSIGDGEQPD